jgi:hypothetical protein
LCLQKLKRAAMSLRWILILRILAIMASLRSKRVLQIQASNFRVFSQFWVKREIITKLRISMKPKISWKTQFSASF